MSEFRNDATPNPAGQERTSFHKQWTRRIATLDPRADESADASSGDNEHQGQFSFWNWVIIVAMVISLGWYITKLPATLGLH